MFIERIDAHIGIQLIRTICNRNFTNAFPVKQ